MLARRNDELSLVESRDLYPYGFRFAVKDAYQLPHCAPCLIPIAEFRCGAAGKHYELGLLREVRAFMSESYDLWIDGGALVRVFRV